jgi:hypothetical protein
MGGRKSYNLVKVLGKTAQSARARQRLTKSIESKESKKIASSALDLLARSDKALDSLAEVVETFDFVRSNAEGSPLDREARRRLASKFWTEKKKETETPSDSVLDRIIVDSVTKFIRRGRRK